jgi:dihydroorotase
MLDESGKLLPYLLEARQRGVLFDVGHGAGSFVFHQAVPAVKQGFVPDSISTDLHAASMNAGMKDMLNVMSKFLNMGMSLPDVIRSATHHPARQIRRPELGTLRPGSPADLAILSLHRGSFGFVDVDGTRMPGRERLECELTVFAGEVVWDRNGTSRPSWEDLASARSIDLLARQRALGDEIKKAMRRAASYLPAVREALSLLDQRVVDDVAPRYELAARLR